MSFNGPPTTVQQLPPKKKHSPSFWILIALGVVILLFFGSCAVIVLSATTQGVKVLASESPSDSSATVGNEPTVTESSAAPKEQKKGFSPKKTDFAIKIKITSKHCYGSAGCNLEFKVTPLLAISRSKLPSTGQIDVSYTIQGGEDGPLEDTVTVYLEDDTTDIDEQYLSTRNKSVKLKAAITSVEYNN